jgi:hypothetical protein
MAVSSVLCQTRPPDALWIIDDNPEGQRQDLSKHPVIGQLLASAKARTPVTVLKGLGEGPAQNHEEVRIEAKELVWRVDDDETPEPRVLEMLETGLINHPKLGAIAGLVPVPPIGENPHASSAIEDIGWAQNAQWYKPPAGAPQLVEAGHLHSSYLYRKNAAQYRLDLSKVGHREETFHTVQMRLNGWDLAICTDAVTWHFRQTSGGIRSQTGDYAGDDAKFKDWLRTLPFKWRQFVHVVAGHGLGDKFALFAALPKIIEYHRARGRGIRLFAPANMLPLFQIRQAEGVEIIDMATAAQYSHCHDGEIYGWMGTNKHSGGIEAAYVQYYTEGQEKWLI